MGRILIVDDSERTRRLIRLPVRHLRHEPIEAASGIEALEEARSAPPDLILLDIVMPGMSGLEVASMLRADPRFGTVPIVALTADVMPGVRERCLAAGCSAYVTKPIDTRTLPVLIAGYLGSSAFPADP